MIRIDIYFACEYGHQKKIVDRLRFSALMGYIYDGCLQPKVQIPK